jgi:hypothetical protein
MLPTPEWTAGDTRCLVPRLLAPQVKRLRDILAAHADEVFSLENRKQQLALSMEERKQEVEVHRCAK